MKRTRITTILAAAALVVTACNGDDAGDADANGDAANGATLQVEAGDLYFEPEELSASAGEIEVVLDNVGDVEHDFVIEEEDDTVVVHADPGETATGTITLDAGTYTFYCSIPGHRATMEGVLEVS